MLTIFKVDKILIGLTFWTAVAYEFFTRLEKFIMCPIRLTHWHSGEELVGVKTKQLMYSGLRPSTKEDHTLSDRQTGWICNYRRLKFLTIFLGHTFNTCKEKYSSDPWTWTQTVHTPHFILGKLISAWEVNRFSANNLWLATYDTFKSWLNFIFLSFSDYFTVDNWKWVQKQNKGYTHPQITQINQKIIQFW